MNIPEQFLPPIDFVNKTNMQYTNCFGDVYKILKISDSHLMTLEKTDDKGNKSVWFKYPDTLKINPEYSKYIEMKG